MKQILALMTFLLVMLLMITTVMAVGNAKQSEMMTQRAQLITSLRAELRSEKQEKEELTGLLAREQTTACSLRKEKDALNQRLNRLMQMVRNQSAGVTDVSGKSQSTFADTVPLWSVQAAMPEQGEEWLQVRALENTLTELLAQRVTKSDGEMQTVTAVAAVQPLTTPVATSAVISFAPATTQPPKPVPTPAPIALTAQTATPAPTSTPAPTVAPAVFPLLAKAAGNALSRMNQLLRWLEETLQQLTERLLTCCPLAGEKPYHP